MAKKYGIQIKGLGKALRASGLGVLRPKPTGKGGKLLKPKPIRPGKRDGGSAKKGVQEKKRSAKNREEFKKNMAKASPDVKMYLKHGKAFPGFDQSRRIRGGLKQGGRAKFPDLTGDGKVTRADVLKGRGVFAEGGKVKVKDKVKDKGAFETESRRQRQKQRQRIKRIGEGLRDINPLPLPKLKKKDK